MDSNIFVYNKIRINKYFSTYDYNLKRNMIQFTCRFYENIVKYLTFYVSIASLTNRLRQSFNTIINLFYRSFWINAYLEPCSFGLRGIPGI